MAARVNQYKIYFRPSRFPTTDAELYAGLTEGAGGFPRRNIMNLKCPGPEVLDPWIAYDIDRDPSESWPISLDQLDVDQKALDELTRLVHLDRPEGDYRPSLLQRQYASRKVEPCCNPPYCYCKGDTYG